MTSIASQVILHPSVSATLRFGGSNVARDKVYRAVQYASRFLAWYCYRKGYAKQTVARFQAIKSTLGNSRKLMRLGKPVEHLQAALKALSTSANAPLLSYLALGRQLSYAGYLSYDTFVWTQNAKITAFDPARAKKNVDTSYKFWASGLLFGLASGLVKLRDIKAREVKNARRRASSEKEVERQAEMKKIAADRAAALQQMLQDTLDLAIPMYALQYATFLDDGIVGIAGFITSVLGARAVWRNVNGAGK